MNNPDDADFIARRLRMVDQQMVRRGIRNKAVLDAMRTVPRHLFIPEQSQDKAYHDGPVSIGRGQTISQPYIVASMTEYLRLDPESKALEVGTGCGYQTAVLSEITPHVFSIERIAGLLEDAQARLNRLGYASVQTMLGDGSEGWPEAAPFDAIIVTAAAPAIPQTLCDQLVEGGRMVIPVDRGTTGRQDLLGLVRTPTGIEQEVLYEVRFVPLLGEIDG
ncbi:MAG: protein-L-isoaspartate(D-aspartate) O-methyltransferase [candidate division Zixibacteria bacterium]|nr:protein-L-isoaspartate(D-aspartate) O-methyltransferase [candidate division Zixibacteria bacterium]